MKLTLNTQNNNGNLKLRSETLILNIKNDSRNLKLRSETMLTILLFKKETEEDILKRRFLSISISVLQLINDIPDWQECLQLPQLHPTITQGKGKWKDIIKEVGEIINQFNTLHSAINECSPDRELDFWVNELGNIPIKIYNILKTERRNNPYVKKLSYKEC